MINLKGFNMCPRCSTITKNDGMCSFCIKDTDVEQKSKDLLELASIVLWVDGEIPLVNKYPAIRKSVSGSTYKPKDICSLCKTSPKAGNYLIYSDITVCRSCQKTCNHTFIVNGARRTKTCSICCLKKKD